MPGMPASATPVVECSPTEHSADAVFPLWPRPVARVRDVFGGVARLSIERIVLCHSGQSVLGCSDCEPLEPSTSS
eukprot:4161891-Pyramimonas_sp.AAC.1